MSRDGGRISACSTNRPAPTAPSHGPASPTTSRATLLYRASQFGCAPCPLKARCRPNGPVRAVPRAIYEGARDMARDLARSEEGKTSRRAREKVEMLFAHRKRILTLDRLRLRGPNGAKDAFHRAAAAQNLRTLATVIPVPQPSPARPAGDTRPEGEDSARPSPISAATASFNEIWWAQTLAVTTPRTDGSRQRSGDGRRAC